MARAAVPLLLLALLGAAAAIEIAKKESAQLQRMLNSPITQTLAERLDLQLPEVPQIDIDPLNVDLNALLAQAADVGCVPFGVQVSDNVAGTVQQCVRQAYQSVTTISLAPRRSLGRRKRNVNRFVQRMRDRAMLLAKQCMLNGLSLISAESGELDQTAINALIDDMTADEVFKTQKKSLVDICLTTTPEEITEVSQRRQFQLECIAELNKLECSVGIADSISPTVGFFKRMQEGKCLTKGLEQPARAEMAETACLAEEVSALMRSRLDETEVSTGRRRRRRDLELMNQLQKFTSMDSIEKALGAAPATAPRRCRPTRRRRCRKTRPPPVVTVEELNTTLARAEELLGPLNETFASIPEMMLSACSCWHDTMGTTDGAGGVDVSALQAVIAEATGPEEFRMALNSVITTCDNMGAAVDVDSFTGCLVDSAGYACGILEVMKGMMEMPASG